MASEPLASIIRLLVAAAGIAVALVIGGPPLLYFLCLFLGAKTITAARIYFPGNCSCECIAWQQLLRGNPNRAIGGLAGVGIAATTALQTLGSRGSLNSLGYVVLFLLLLVQVCTEVMLRKPDSMADRILVNTHEGDQNETPTADDGPSTAAIEMTHSPPVQPANVAIDIETAKEEPRADTQIDTSVGLSIRQSTREEREVLQQILTAMHENESDL